ncbi:MAG: Rnf-Nqr domain containing protein, partial [Angelakisella sp.]
LGIYLPLITTNCAVLGVTVLNIGEGYSFVESMVNSLGGGLGFMLAMVLFCGVRTRIANSKITQSFDGIPITLIAASIVSMSFMGFGGLIEGMIK